MLNFSARLHKYKIIKMRHVLEEKIIVIIESTLFLYIYNLIHYYLKIRGVIHFNIRIIINFIY